MKEMISKIWKDILHGENIDSYLTILFAIVLSTVSLLGIDLGERMAGATLAVLALLAVTNLVNRYRLDAVLKQKTRDFFAKDFPESFQEDMNKAKELWLIGYSLSRTVITYSTLIDEKITHRGNVKVLLLDPNENGSIYANKSLYYPMSDEQYRGRINVTLSGLREISKSKKSGMQVRIIDFPFSFGAYAMDIMSTNGKIYIENYEYKTKPDGPRFLLTPKDEYWYEYYRDQILALWKDAKPYEL